MPISFAEHPHPSTTGLAYGPGDSAYPNLWKNLIGCYPLYLETLASRPGATTGVRDYSPDRNHGNLDGVDYSNRDIIPGFGHGISFDGTTSEAIEFGDTFNTTLTDKLTIHCVIRHDGSGSGDFFFSDSQQGGFNYNWGLYRSTGVVIFYMRTSSVVAVVATEASNIGDVDVVTGVYDGQNIYLYRNGQLHASAAQSGNIASQANTTTSICGGWNTFNGYPGTVYEAMAWNRALDKSEVLALHAGASPLMPVRLPKIGKVGTAAGTTTALVDSKQAFSVTIDDTNPQSNTATITSVDTSLSCIFPRMYRDDAITDDADDNYYSYELTNGTTVTVARGRSLATGNTATVVGDVVTFNSAVVEAVHHGSITLTGGTHASNTSSSFNATLDNCAVIYLGIEALVTNDALGRSWCNLTKGGSDGAVTVTATREDISSVGQDVTVQFAIIEFKSAALRSLQEVETAIPSDAVAAAAGIEPVTMGNSVTIFGGIRTEASGTGYDAAPVRAHLEGESSLLFERVGIGASTTSTTTVTVVEFLSGAVDSVERVSELEMGSADTTTNTTLGTTLTDTDTVFVSYLGFTRDDTVDTDPHPAVDHATLEITSTTNIRQQRNTAANNSLKQSVEVIQGAAAAPSSGAVFMSLNPWQGPL